MDCSLEDLAGILRSENHTVKRSVVDQRLLNRIGNAYSDEIPHAVGLSSTTMASKLSDGDVERL